MEIQFGGKLELRLGALDRRGEKRSDQSRRGGGGGDKILQSADARNTRNPNVTCRGQLVHIWPAADPATDTAAYPTAVFFKNFFN